MNHLVMAAEKEVVGEEEGEGEGASVASSTSSLERARGHLERAEKKTRPTVRRWKPKMKVAGDEFCKAAVLYYKVGKLMELTFEMLSFAFVIFHQGGSLNPLVC